MFIEQAVTQLRQLVREHPIPYSLVCSWRRTVLRKDARLADRSSELCIEGYPSSGNTFAELTVGEVWPGLRIATHRHCIAAVKRALGLGVPTVVLIREPYGAISSCVVRFGMPLRRAVQEYRHFYEWLEGEPRPLVLEAVGHVVDDVRALDGGDEPRLALEPRERAVVVAPEELHRDGAARPCVDRPEHLREGAGPDPLLEAESALADHGRGSGAHAAR